MIHIYIDSPLFSKDIANMNVYQGALPFKYNMDPRGKKSYGGC